MTITFVSSLLGKENCQNIHDMLHDFEIVCMNGPVCLYVAPEFQEIVAEWAVNWPSVKVQRIVRTEETWLYNICETIGEEIFLPDNRNAEKDTRAYILNGYSKHEFLEETILENPWNTSHFLWIDMHIPQLFKNRIGSGEYLRWLTKVTLKESFIAFPGCWSKLEKEKIEDVLKGVHWRFCGGFLFGDGETILKFCEKYKRNIQEFLKEYCVLIWDFNFWAYMETFCNEELSDSCIWYKGDHNDSILNSSADIYTRKLKIRSSMVYDYPKIETYYPTSAAYLYYDGKHWLNTRYVNYWIYPNGCYLFNNRDGKKLIENKNVLSELDGDTMTPVSYREVVENIDLEVNTDVLSRGLEDIRIY